MIRIYLSELSTVGSAGHDLVLGPGQWDLPGLTYVTVGTNAAVGVSNLVSGSIVTVDKGGQLVVTEGPNLVGPVVEGFSLALVSLGILLGIRWVVGKMMRAIGAGYEIAE